MISGPSSPPFVERRRTKRRAAVELTLAMDRGGPPGRLARTARRVGGHPATGRLSLAGAGLVAWVLVGALAAGPAAPDDRWLGLPDISDMVLIMIAVLWALAVVQLVVLVLSGQRNEDLELPPRRPLWVQMVKLLFLLGLAYLLSRIDRGELEFEPPPELVPKPPAGAESGLAPVPTVSGGEVVVIIVAVALAAALVWWTRRRTLLVGEDGPDGQSADDELARHLAPIVAVAVQDLALEADPRRAVMQAYAGVEAALAAVGHPRGPAETPSEYLARILGPVELGVDPEPLVTLAQLHEVARFSHHPVTEGDRDRALAALSEARRQLTPAATGPGPALSPSEPGPGDGR